MSTPQPLDQPFVTVTLDGSGNGIAKIGPTIARQHWQVAGASVNVATNAKEAICKCFLGSTFGAATFFSSTTTGSTGDVCSFGGMDIQSGMFIWAQWIGGDAGAIATMTINGTYSTGPPS